MSDIFFKAVFAQTSAYVFSSSVRIFRFSDLSDFVGHGNFDVVKPTVPRDLFDKTRISCECICIYAAVSEDNYWLPTSS